MVMPELSTQAPPSNNNSDCHEEDGESGVGVGAGGTGGNTRSSMVSASHRSLSDTTTRTRIQLLVGRMISPPMAADEFQRELRTEPQDDEDFSTLSVIGKRRRRRRTNAKLPTKLLLGLSIVTAAIGQLVIYKELSSTEKREDVHHKSQYLLSLNQDDNGQEVGKEGKTERVATLKVFTGYPPPLPPNATLPEEEKWKQKIILNRMKAMVAPAPDNDEDETRIKIEHVVLVSNGQRSFLEQYGLECYPSNNGRNAVLERYDMLHPTHPHFAQELWKYCTLYLEGGAYLDGESPLLTTFYDAFIRSSAFRGSSGDGDNKDIKHYAVLGAENYFANTIHGSFLMIPNARSNVMKQMIQILVETSKEVLDSSPLLLPRTLYKLIAEEVSVSGYRGGGNGAGTALKPGPNGRWILLEQRCAVDLLMRHDDGLNKEGRYETLVERGLGVGVGVDAKLDGQMESASPLLFSSLETASQSHRLTHHCPVEAGYCCSISDPTMHEVVLMTRHPLLPYQLLPPVTLLPHPFSHDKAGDIASLEGQADFDYDDLPFVSTVRETILPSPQTHRITPNFFETMASNDCLPLSKNCTDCLRKMGATCNSCAEKCSCYCKNLCKTKVEKKVVTKEVMVTPPLYSRDPSRLVPKIVHQTWFETVTKVKYPNMSRLIESWKRSGWEYRFYNDDDAAKFLVTHFPPEVKEAYDAIIPGAYKADIFRYCVLLIYGGVYADMDILLETNLDEAISGDVGFMAPVDMPGGAVRKRMCLWNGLIAAAPGHPYLAQVIEMVVNNIRNRFTAIDYDNMLCPNPELSIPRTFDTLFPAGPCILGLSVNKVLRRHPQTQFEAGDIDPFANDRHEAAKRGTSFVVGTDDPRLRIPGRTIILHQNKRDMGAHRFTWLEKNLVVAATDMPNYDDRKRLKVNFPTEHYHKTKVGSGIYGLEKLYVDRKIANEDIRFIGNTKRVPFMS